MQDIRSTNTTVVVDSRPALLAAPQTRAEDAELADDVAGHDSAVGAQDGVARAGRRLNQLHEDVAAVFALGDRDEEGRDRGAVDVVAAALALGLQDVVSGGDRVEREVEARGRGGRCGEEVVLGSEG